MKSDDFFVRFWGVRGSIPCPGPDYLGFGGNSSCVEIRCGAHVFVLDAGSGIRPLGTALTQEGVRDIDLLFSHCHYDHVSGLPFFDPLFNADSTVRIWAGHLEDGMTCEEMVTDFMKPPFFPVAPDIFTAQVQYRDFRAGDTFDPKKDVTVKTAPLQHPNGAAGYRFEYGGKSICYVTDTEHVPGTPDQEVLKLIDQADIVIYDGMFSDEEHSACVGYGHSTWEEGLRLCDMAQAKRYVIFHHCPSHKDEELEAVEKSADAKRSGSVVAREGMVLRP